jgi:PleD family two-component response regulator
VVVLNLDAAGDERKADAYRELAARLTARLGSRRLPIIVLSRHRIDRPLGVSEVLDGPVGPARIATRTEALTRISTMHREALRRLETARRFGVVGFDPVIDTGAGAPTILVVGAGRSFLSVEAAFSGQGTVVGALTSGQAMTALDQLDVDLILVDAIESTPPLLQSLRRDPRRAAMPVVAVAEGHDLDELYRLGLTDQVETGDLGGLRRRLCDHVAEHRAREALRAVYWNTRRHVAHDETTGLFGRDVFIAHAERVFEDVETGHEQAVVGVFVIGPVSERANRTVGPLFGLAARAEDFVAHVAPGRFAVLFPATDLDGARLAADRLTAIVRQTATSLGALHIDYALGEPSPTETAMALLERVGRMAEARAR